MLIGTLCTQHEMSITEIMSEHYTKPFSKKELREMIPGLSKWQIDQARRHAAEEGTGKPVVSAPITRTHLDPVKTNHFVNFIL